MLKPISVTFCTGCQVHKTAAGGQNIHSNNYDEKTCSENNKIEDMRLCKHLLESTRRVTGK